jgi:hypothetical protein
MANGDPVTKGPWWAELIKTIGPTAAIALYLVYSVGVQLNGKVDTNSEDIRSLIRALGPHIAATARIANALNVQTAVAVQQCINQAESKNDRVAESRCWTAWKEAKPNSDTTTDSNMP